MALKKLPIGIDDFVQLRQNDFYYADKTGMIKELLENWGSVNLFTRPRRFGKSLNMSMLKSFFEIGTDQKLFDGLSVSQEKQLCEKYMGQFPVISLTLKQVNGGSFEEAKTQLWTAVRFEARRFSSLMESDALYEDDKEILRNLRLGKGELESSVMQLSEFLYTHYKRKVIILIDEYDVPLQKACQNGYYNEMVRLIGQIFGYSMKSNPYMEFAVVTGCLRIAKESIFTGFNNPKIHSIADEQYDEWFGFTDSEVRSMLNYYGKMEYYETTKEWYDGYHFGNVHVYCPWDVINWCDQLANTSDRMPKNFWANTSGNDMIRRFADKADAGTKDQLGSLIEGKSIWKKLNFEVTYNELYDSIENLWSVLLMTGYLTQKSHGEDYDYELIIPNREITRLFISITDAWFMEKVLDDKDSLKEFFAAVDQGNAPALQDCINYYMDESISFLDGGKTEEKESFYHGLLLGMLNSRTDWITKSNREAGDGRFDVVTYPRRGQTAVMFEFKYAKEEKNLETLAQEALDQMKRNRYDKYFGARKPKKIVHFGIAFHKKHCRVLQETTIG